MLSYEIFAEDFDQYQLHSLPNPGHEEVTKVDSVDRLKLIIESNCSEMLAAYRQTKKLLYRGLGSNEQVVITNIRSDRRPVEMYKPTHELLQTAFTEVGLKANRSNSIFCSCLQRTANEWGWHTYVIFVKDGWSGTVFVGVKRGYAFNHLAHGIYDLDSAIEKVKSLRPFVIEGRDALQNVLRVGYEDVLITGSSYIAIEKDSSLLDKVLGYDSGFEF